MDTTNQPQQAVTDEEILNAFATHQDGHVFGTPKYEMVDTQIVACVRALLAKAPAQPMQKLTLETPSVWKWSNSTQAAAQPAPAVSGDLRRLLIAIEADSNESEQRRAIARAALSQQAAQEPVVAWVRYRSDGGIEGPILDQALDEIRRRSGAWMPLIHPAKPAEQEKASRDQKQLSQWLLTSPTNGKPLTFAGPAHEMPMGLCRVKMVDADGNEWTLIAGLREGFKTEAERNATFLRVLEAERAEAEQQTPSTAAQEREKS